MALTPDQTRRFARQIPLIGTEGQMSLCAGSWETTSPTGPARDWERLYLERAGVRVAAGEPPATGEATTLGDEVTGGDAAVPELIGALAAAEALVALLAGTKPKP